MKSAGIKTISLVSKLPYIGNTGSGSVSGYYTIWTVKMAAHGNAYYIKGQPQPRKINQTIVDLAKFRGKLWMIGDGNEFVRVMARECSECGELSLITEGSERCNQCYDKDLWGLKE